MRYDKRLDLFSATQPLETLKLRSRGQVRQGASRIALPSSTSNVLTYFHAPVRRPIFIGIPKEDLEAGDEGCVGQLEFSLYGTSDAAQNWAHEYTTFLVSLGFQVGSASPCNFVQKGSVRPRGKPSMPPRRVALGFILIPVFGSDVCVGGGVEQKGMDQAYHGVVDEACGEWGLPLGCAKVQHNSNILTVGS